MTKRISWIILLNIFLSAHFSLFSVALASHQDVDEIETILSKDIVERIRTVQKDLLSEKDKAYCFFMLAVYDHDPLSRKEAERIYKQLETPESEAFLGSIEILKARDLNSDGFFQGMIDLFKKRRYVQNGIRRIDKAASEHPKNFQIRIVQAITYLDLPSIFGKFDAGFREMQNVLNLIEEGKVKVPASDPLFRDKSSLYYYAGRYFLKSGRIDQAKKLFEKSADVFPNSPFVTASKRRIAKLQSKGIKNDELKSAVQRGYPVRPSLQFSGFPNKGNKR